MKRSAKTLSQQEIIENFDSVKDVLQQTSFTLVEYQELVQLLQEKITGLQTTTPAPPPAPLTTAAVPKSTASKDVEVIDYTQQINNFLSNFESSEFVTKVQSAIDSGSSIPTESLLQEVEELIQTIEIHSAEYKHDRSAQYPESTFLLDFSSHENLIHHVRLVYIHRNLYGYGSTGKRSIEYNGAIIPSSDRGNNAQKDLETLIQKFGWKFITVDVFVYLVNELFGEGFENGSWDFDFGEVYDA